VTNAGFAGRRVLIQPDFEATRSPPTASGILLQFLAQPPSLTDVTKDTFRKEIAAAVKAFDKYIVCLEKSPEEFEVILGSLVQKAITAYEKRGPNLRHGIALDKQVTVILSQSDEAARPLCGIYFNLHSPYQKNALPKTVKAIGETVGDAGTED
jgi:hypothetical protein